VSPSGRGHREAGFTTIQYVAATGLSLLLFVLIANLLVDLYARGAARTALEEGVRAAVPAGTGPADCEARAREVIASIAGGSLLRVDELRCAYDGETIVAHARVSLQSWLPMTVPDWRLTLEAVARPER
jgi:hypothetical protein